MQESGGRAFKGKEMAMAMVPKRLDCLGMAGLPVYLEQEEESWGWWQVMRSSCETADQ